MQDYGIVVGRGDLVGRMSWEPCDTIINNIYISLAVERGRWWLHPDFGLRRRERLKNTVVTAALLRHDYLEALQWLVDVGRAQSIDVQVMRNPSVDRHRVAIRIEVRQADGRDVTFNVFREVV